MKQFDYNEYRKCEDVLNEYYDSIGFDHEAVWDIHKQLGKILIQMWDGSNVDENHAFQVIEDFVNECKKIKDAALYPLSVQESLQALILIALYPTDEYEVLAEEAYKAAHIFHTHIYHPGE